MEAMYGAVRFGYVALEAMVLLTLAIREAVVIYKFVTILRYDHNVLGALWRGERGRGGELLRYEFNMMCVMDYNTSRRCG